MEQNYEFYRNVNDLEVIPTELLLPLWAFLQNMGWHIRQWYFITTNNELQSLFNEYINIRVPFTGSAKNISFSHE